MSKPKSKTAVAIKIQEGGRADEADSQPIRLWALQFKSLAIDQAISYMRRVVVLVVAPAAV